MPPDLPRFVPTLTEVVEAGAVPSHKAVSAPVAEAPAVIATPVARPPGGQARLQDDLAEQIAHRVLQRVDAALEDRLVAAIRSVVERHTETLLPTLREEIVAAVQDTVARALAEELVAPSASAPG